MELIIKKQIGKKAYTFVVAGNNLFELVHQSQKLSFEDVCKCGICKSDDLYLNARTPQNKYKYTEVKCNKCRSRVIFGHTQEDPDTYYLRKDKTTKQPIWEKYQPKEHRKL